MYSYVAAVGVELVIHNPAELCEASLSQCVCDCLQAMDIKYSGFIEKEKTEYEKYRKMENAQIPEDLDFNKISGLLNETKTKFSMVKPKSFGQASRIPGVTPADISVLMVYVSKNKHVSRGTVDL